MADPHDHYLRGEHCEDPSMVEFVSRVFLTVVFVGIAVPFVALVTKPYVLVSALFRQERYWHTVRRTYLQLIRGTIDWGSNFQA
jgi:hypothetical protein